MFWWNTAHIPPRELGPARGPFPPGLLDAPTGQTITTPHTIAPGRTPAGREYERPDRRPGGAPGAAATPEGVPPADRWWTPEYRGPQPTSEQILGLRSGVRVPRGVLPIAGRLSGNPILALAASLLDRFFGGRTFGGSAPFNADREIAEGGFVSTPFGPSGGSPLLRGELPPDTYLQGDWSSGEDDDLSGEDISTPDPVGQEGTEGDAPTPEEPSDPDPPQDMGGRTYGGQE